MTAIYLNYWSSLWKFFYIDGDTFLCVGGGGGVGGGGVFRGNSYKLIDITNVLR